VSWWIWLVISIVIGVVELTTFTFVLLWIAIAGLITTCFTALIPELWGQVLLFAIASAVLLTVTRPIARKWKHKKTFPTHQETLRLKRGVVVKEGTTDKYAIVRIDGELWSAESEQPLRVGQSVIVRSSSRTVLFVEPSEED